MARTKRLRVGVLYGGRSSEHEVSLASAASVFANLDRDRYEPVAIRLEKDGRWVLADRPPSAPSAADVIDQMRNDTTRRGGREVILPPRPGEDSLLLVDRRSSADAAEAVAAVTGLSLDVVFPVLHGPYGEDGTVQGLLELANLPYVGCGVLASALAMDKAVCKTVCRARGLLVPDWVVVTRPAWDAAPAVLAATIGERLVYPLFVKPANLGSSIGITRVASPEALGPAVELALSFDRKAVVENAVPNAREIECAVLGNEHPEASLPGEIVPAREFYDYEAKYIDAGSVLHVPADLDGHVVDQIRRAAVSAFEAIDGSGLARVDFLLDRATGLLYLNEVNTLPGFTTISMFAKMWAASSVDYPTLVDRLITLARERHAARQTLRTSVI